jgi:hypothetical protein
MKKQEQINALQVRIERIEAHLAEQHKGNNFGKLADAVSESVPGVKETAPYMDAFESSKAEFRHKADVMNAYIQAWLDYNNLPYGMDYLAELDKVVIKAEQYYRRIYAL